MPRYFFDLDDGEGVLRDPEGTELADLAEAQSEATDTLTQIGKDTFRGKTDEALRMSIRDEDDAVVMHLALTFLAKSMI